MKTFMRVPFRPNGLQILVALVLLTLLNQCNDRPTPLGSDLIVDTLQFEVLTSADTTLFHSVRTIYYPLSLFNSGTLFIGSTPEMIAFSFLTPTVFPLSPDSIAAAEIVSTELVLTPRPLVYGDSTTNKLRFTIHELQRLLPPNATIDTIRRFEQEENFLGPPIVTVDVTIPPSDSAEPLRIALPSEIVQRWLELKGSESGQDTTIFGIALIPDSVGSSVIRGFYSLRPGFTDLPGPYYEVVFRRGDSLDTVRIESGYDLSVIALRQSLPPDRLIIQGGLSYRTLFLFDVSALPPLAIIHKATLTLPYDPTGSFSSQTDSSLTLAAYLPADSALSTIGSPFPLGLAQPQAGHNRFVFDNIAPALELWTSKRQRSALLLTIDREHNTLDRVALYPPEDSLQSPTLRIIYSIPVDSQLQQGNRQ